MQRFTAIRSPGAIALLAAVLFICVSTALGTYFGWALGSHQSVALGVIFAAGGLAGELLKPFAVRSAFRVTGWGSIPGALACALVSGVCVVYSLAGDLAFSAGSRGDLAAERQSEANTASGAAEDRRRAVDELATLAKARPVSELRPLVATAPKQCRIHVSLGNRETICTKDAKLLAELGRAERREKLEAIIAKSRSTTASPKQADPLASAVAFYLSAAGYEVKAADLAVWLYLLPVIFFQIGSAFGLVVADRERRPAVPATVAETVVETVAPASTVVEFPKTQQPSNRQSATRRPEGLVVAFPKTAPKAKAETLAFVLHHIAEHGELPSQDYLAQRAGVTKGAVSKWLKQWEGEGQIKRVRSGRNKMIGRA